MVALGRLRATGLDKGYRYLHSNPVEFLIMVAPGLLDFALVGSPQKPVIKECALVSKSSRPDNRSC